MIAFFAKKCIERLIAVIYVCCEMEFSTNESIDVVNAEIRPGSRSRWHRDSLDQSGRHAL
jgi:hypothetical protein